MLTELSVSRSCGRMANTCFAGRRADGACGRSATLAVLFAVERPLNDTSRKLATPMAK
jgi:hypothetical protein